MDITYIDAHGPDHGLSIVIDLDRHRVHIRQWGELCEPDHDGNVSPHVRSGIISLDALMDPNGKHFSCGRVNTTSQRAKVASLALNWMSYWGGDEEMLDEADRPCKHFGSFWGRLLRRDAPPPAHLKCGCCGALPSDEP